MNFTFKYLQVFVAISFFISLLMATFSQSTELQSLSNSHCHVMAQYFERIGKPLNEEAMAILDESICQRFEAVIRKRGVSTVDKKLRALLVIRKMRKRYQQCMEQYNFIQYCHRFVINRNSGL